MTIEDRLRTISNEPRLRRQQLTRLGAQLIRAADRKVKKPKPKSESALQTPRAKGWCALSDLSRLLKQNKGGHHGQ